MALPDYPREIYKKNPLAEVVCQVRFATLSKLSGEQLNTFWDAVYDHFPQFEQDEGSESTDATAELLSNAYDVSPSQELYNFISEDEYWTLSLTEDALALTCRSYERWEEFSELLFFALNALREVYEVQTFLRVGLRYLDVVQRSVIGLDDVSWSQLLAEPLVGELASLDIGHDIEDVTREFIFRLNDKHTSRVRVQHGYVQIEGQDEICYLVDSDFYTDEEVKTSDAKEILEMYNRYARRFFRWCITERLHTAMEPVQA